MAEQTLTAAELEGERELSRLIESGELASTTPKLNESLTDEDDNPKPADAPKPDDSPAAAPEKPADAPAAEPKPADAEPEPEAGTAHPDTAAIEAQLAAEQQALLTATQQRIALEDAQKQLATKYSEINPALDELADKLDNGELTQGQYDKQSRALEQERAELERQYNANTGKLNDIMVVEQEASGKIQSLEAAKDPLTITVNTFLSQPVNAIYKDDTAARALGSLFQTLKTLPRMAGKTDAELLALADKQYRTLNDIEQPAAAPAQPTKPAPARETPEQKAARLANTVPTGISGMPPVVTNTGGNEYTDLASKSGPEIEAAFAKMTAEQQEAFLLSMK